MTSRVAVITGASRGVGMETAKQLTKKGWFTIGLARSRGKLSSVRKDIGDRFNFFAVDIADYDKVADVFHQIGQKYECIDLLVNNAAVFKRARFTECDSKDIVAMVDTNLKGSMFCTHRALSLLRRPGGRIINIASVAATHGIMDQSIYCASKYGIDGFSEALSQELVGEGITVSTICPGGINTPLWNKEKNPYPGDLKSILNPSDIASLVEYIANLPQNIIMKKVVMFPTNEWH